MKNQKGFSLVELLVVVIIIAIIAAIAIPSLLASRRAANEASAISSLRTIHSAQATYFSTNGANTNYAAALGPVGTAGTLSQLGLIDSVLGAGAKSGYNFANSVAAATATTLSTYCATATPSSSGLTGTGIRIFGVHTPGVIYTSDAAGANPPQCATGVFTQNGSTPIQ